MGEVKDRLNEPGTIIVEAERNPRINASAQCHTDGASERSRFALALRMSMSAMTATRSRESTFFIR